MSHLTKILLLALILTAVIVLPSYAANVTYPQEYYTLSKYKDEIVNSGNFSIKDDMGGPSAELTLINYYELRRQTILLEQQNELLAEQNTLLANQTITGRKLRCTFYVNGVGSCGEWTVI
jgi:hypothetical protein